MGSILVKTWFDLWDIRNKERHGKDAEEQKEKRKENLRTQLEELYQLKGKVRDAHRLLFFADVETHMKAKPHLDGLEDWINTFGPAIHTSVKERLDIRNFFQQGGVNG